MLKDAGLLCRRRGALFGWGAISRRSALAFSSAGSSSSIGAISRGSTSFALGRTTFRSGGTLCGDLAGSLLCGALLHHLLLALHGLHLLRCALLLRLLGRLHLRLIGDALGIGARCGPSFSTGLALSGGVLLGDIAHLRLCGLFRRLVLLRLGVVRLRRQLLLANAIQIALSLLAIFLLAFLLATFFFFALFFGAFFLALLLRPFLFFSLLLAFLAAILFAVLCHLLPCSPCLLPCFPCHFLCSPCHRLYSSLLLVVFSADLAFEADFPAADLADLVDFPSLAFDLPAVFTAFDDFSLDIFDLPDFSDLVDFPAAALDLPDLTDLVDFPPLAEAVDLSFTDLPLFVDLGLADLDLVDVPEVCNAVLMPSSSIAVEPSFDLLLLLELFFLLDLLAEASDLPDAFEEIVFEALAVERPAAEAPMLDLETFEVRLFLLLGSTDPLE
ncbi:hypothetical protein TYRP_001209 [Tyrophagus putrescentiae]|nr:hypothetical protein TYRP_001209 [Tyrophagus putrescentiae]